MRTCAPVWPTRARVAPEHAYRGKLAGHRAIAFLCISAETGVSGRELTSLSQLNYMRGQDVTLG